MAKKPNGYWTKEKCKEDALKYNGRTEWIKSSRSAYVPAMRNGWIDECCGHMLPPQKPKGYWTKEKCKEDALKYNSKIKWVTNSSSAYGFASRNGWFDECCGHMLPPQKPNGYWTKEKCKEDALKYNTKTEWGKSSGGAYNSVCKNGWIDECCGHMKIVGNLYKRMIYIFYVKREVYVGLTCNFNKRKSTHKTKGNNQYSYLVQKYGEKNIQWKKLTDYIDAEKAQIKEIMYIKELRLHGCTVLNIAKGGELGGRSIYWTKENCKEDALKYNTKTEWKNSSSGAQYSARINGWFDECCEHMLQRQYKPYRYWTKENCKEDALKYNTKTEWKNSSSGYTLAYKNGWFD